MHRLQKEVAARVSAVPEFAIPGTNDSGAEVAILKAKLAKSEAERDAMRASQQMDTHAAERSGLVRASRSMTAGSPLPPRDGRVASDVLRSSGSREVVVRDAFEFADCGSVAKLTALLAQGAAKLHAMSEAGDEVLLLRSEHGEGRFALS